jgi:hypothetical protein
VNSPFLHAIRVWPLRLSSRVGSRAGNRCMDLCDDW